MNNTGESSCIVPCPNANMESPKAPATAHPLSADSPNHDFGLLPGVDNFEYVLGNMCFDEMIFDFDVFHAAR